MTAEAPWRAPERWPYRRVLGAACAWALHRWLGRWAVFVAVAALVASAGAGLDTALATVAALAAWAALPLARGAASGVTGAVLAVGFVVTVGTGLVWAVRQLLWPARWREAERALPIAPRDALRADVPWIALAALPWATLQVGGLAVWLAQRPAWLAGREAAVVVAAAIALGLTLAAGLGLQGLRRRGGWRRGVAAAIDDRRSGRAVPARLSPWRPLVGWPLVRGVAPRFARLGALTLFASLALQAALAWRPAWAAWWLALQSVLALVALSRARVLAALELRPLLAAGAALPLSARGWTARLDALCAAPALLGVVLLSLAAMAQAPGVRGAVLAVWCGWLALAALLELRAPVADASVQSARWLFMLAVALALASEGLAA